MFWNLALALLSQSGNSAPKIESGEPGCLKLRVGLVRPPRLKVGQARQKCFCRCGRSGGPGCPTLQVGRVRLPELASRAGSFDHGDIAAFTEAMLLWWRNHKGELPAWSEAARIMFALTPNSAACERVFSLLKIMFSDEQRSCLGDMLQGSLMLRYNKRQL